MRYPSPCLALYCPPLFPIVAPIRAPFRVGRRFAKQIEERLPPLWLNRRGGGDGTSAPASGQGTRAPAQPRLARRPPKCGRFQVSACGVVLATPAAGSPPHCSCSGFGPGGSLCLLVSFLRLCLPVRSPLFRRPVQPVPWPLPLVSSALFGLVLLPSPCPLFRLLTPPPLRAGLASACFPPALSASVWCSPLCSLPVLLFGFLAGSLSPPFGGAFFCGVLFLSGPAPKCLQNQIMVTRRDASTFKCGLDLDPLSSNLYTLRSSILQSARRSEKPRLKVRFAKQIVHLRKNKSRMRLRRRLRQRTPAVPRRCAAYYDLLSKSRRDDDVSITCMCVLRMIRYSLYRVYLSFC